MKQARFLRSSFSRARGFALLGVALLTLTAPALIAPALVAPQAAGSSAAQRSAEETANLASVPKEVRAALDRALETYRQPLRGARWSSVNVLTGTDHTLYQVRGTNGRGNRIEMEITRAGRIIEVEEHGIPLSEVPSAVVDALSAKMPEFTPTRIEAIYQCEQSQPVCYGFEGEDIAGGEIEVYISADGKTFLN